jgi:hypothetical protein
VDVNGKGFSTTLIGSMNAVRTTLLLASMVCVLGCSRKEKTMANTFGDDVSFLQQHTPIITIHAPDEKGKVAISPSLQGRVMTSTAMGDAGTSFGWINRELFTSGDTLPHINPFGGEERFWLGPEGGQFALFFKKGNPFDLISWQTPALIDTEPFNISEQTRERVVFTQNATLINYSGYEFKLNIRREIKILTVASGMTGVAYQSTNTITNAGEQAWQKETGLISIWLLGMFNPTSGTTIIIPFHPGSEAQLGPVVIDDYFGKVPDDRLVVSDTVCFFKGDGLLRSKIGLNPKRAKNVLGAFDPINNILTIVAYSKPDNATDYVNSKWEIQKEPYSGDVINSYNDGPPAPGAKPLGPFYELETSSAAYALKPGESTTHIQTTWHYQGNEEQLSRIAQKWLGVSIGQIKKIFP